MTKDYADSPCKGQFTEQWENYLRRTQLQSRTLHPLVPLPSCPLVFPVVNPVTHPPSSIPGVPDLKFVINETSTIKTSPPTYSRPFPLMGPGSTSSLPPGTIHALTDTSITILPVRTYR